MTDKTMKTHFYPERASAQVTVTWYGQSGFRLAAGDSRVLVDPFLTDRSDRRYPPPASAADFADVTLVLCTHEHADHMDLPFLSELTGINPGVRIIVPAPVVEIAAGAELDRSRLVAAAPGEVLREGEVTVHPVPALHGLGGALYEELAYAPDGQLLTASYQDYCIPRADDVPPIVVTLDDSAPCRTNPLGAKGCGESGAIGGPPCVTNGVMDALAELGITQLNTPLTLQKIWKAIRDAKVAG